MHVSPEAHLLSLMVHHRENGQNVADLCTIDFCLFYLSVSLEFTLMFCPGNRQCVVRWVAGLCCGE